MRRLLALFAAVVALVAWSAAAQAADTIRVVVHDLSGDGSPSVRNALLRLMSEQPGIELTSRAYFDKVASRLGVSPKDAKGRKAVCRALGLAAVLEGEVDATDDAVSATLRIRGADGEVLETQELSAKTQRELVKQIEQSGWAKLGPALDDAQPAKSDGKRRLVLLELSGNKAGDLRGALEKALGKSADLSLIPEAEAVAARPEEAAKPGERVLVAAALGAVALLRGKLEGNQLTLTVLDGKSGEELGAVQLKGIGIAGLRRSIDADLLKKLAPVVAEAATPVPPKEEIEEESVEADPAPVEPVLAASPLQAVVGFRAGTRNFRYSDDLYGALRAYKMGLTPAAFVGVRWYPAAHFAKGAAAHVGIAASLEQAFLIESRSGDESYETTSREWQLGLHGRLPAGALELGADLGFGGHSFEVSDDASTPLVPDVSYRFLRAGADARYRLGNASFGASFGYRHVTDAGDVQSARWFPRLDVAGLDAGAFAGWAVMRRLDVLAGVLYRRYWFSMNPEPGDPQVAGGALDSYIGGWVGVGWELGSD